MIVNHLHSSIGSKVAVALTGLGLAGFVVFHMLGNLQIFEGAEAINAYAAFLHDMPIVLWTARAGLLMLLVIHMGAALKLAKENRQARPIGYTVRTYRQASLASRTMAISGLFFLLFIVFHVLHMAVGVVDASFVDRVDVNGHVDVYGRMIHAFRNPLVAFIYLAAQVVVALHVSHGVSSSFQTLGLEHPAFNRILRASGPTIAWLVVAGNAAIVLAVLAGVVGTA